MRKNVGIFNTYLAKPKEAPRDGHWIADTNMDSFHIPNKAQAGDLLVLEAGDGVNRSYYTLVTLEPDFQAACVYPVDIAGYFNNEYPSKRVA